LRQILFPLYPKSGVRKKEDEKSYYISPFPKRCKNGLTARYNIYYTRITPNYVKFEDEEKIDIKNLDYKLIKPLIWW